MKDREHRAVPDRVQELVAVPGCGERTVSASPSPMTQATTRSGLSKRRTESMDERVADSPPSWIDPGVSGEA